MVVAEEAEIAALVEAVGWAAVVEVAPEIVQLADLVEMAELVVLGL